MGIPMAKVKKSARMRAKNTQGSTSITKPARKKAVKVMTPLDQMRAAYKAAVREWIAAIKQEEALASVNPSIAEVDKWEGAHFAEDKIRSKVKAAKKQYEDALRKKFYNF